MSAIGRVYTEFFEGTYSPCSKICSITPILGSFLAAYKEWQIERELERPELSDTEFKNFLVTKNIYKIARMVSHLLNLSLVIHGFAIGLLSGFTAWFLGSIALGTAVVCLGTTLQNLPLIQQESVDRNKFY